jgi:transporter family-2 protein
VPSRDTLAAIPWWAWFGGLLGAFYVAISTIVAAELGASSLLALVIAGQLAMALVIDNYGWLGLPVNPLTWTRVLGVALLGAGVWLVAR